MNKAPAKAFIFAIGTTVSSLAQAVTPHGLPSCAFHLQLDNAKSGLLNPRPASNHYLASQNLPLTVHWPEGVTESYASEILSYAETAWTKEFQEMGFRTPHGDGDLGGDNNLDIYISTDLDPGVGGYAGFSGFVEDTPIQDAFGYLVINNNIDVRLRRFVVAHEMFHLSQMAYDWWEDISFMEASATWIGDHVFDDENIYWRYFPFFNQEPYTALDFISLKNPYQYGAGLFTLFLDERFGAGDGSMIRRVWENSVQYDYDNEPDFLDAISTLLPAGVSLGSAYHEFGIWRLLTGSRRKHGFFSERDLWDDRMNPWLEFDSAANPLPALNLQTQKALGPFGQAFLRVKNDTHSEAVLAGRIQGTSSVLQISFVGISADGLRTVPIGTVHGGATIVFSIPILADDEECFVIVTNVTDGTYDADTSPWDGVPFTFSLEKRLALN